MGGDAEAFAPGEYDALGISVTGRSPAYLTRSSLEGDSGRFAPEFDELGNYTGRGAIGVADDLLADQRIMHAAHEISHGIDLRAVPPANRQEFAARQWGIRPPDPNGDIEPELFTIYRDLNNAPGSPVTIYGPRDMGYPAADEPVELWSEAIRAYLADPDYINRVAPNAARAIRDHVNTSPQFRGIIHFNAGGLPIPVGAPLPDTLQQVRLPGGSSVASLPDLVSQAMRSAPPVMRPPLGPAWAAEYHAAHQDPNSPEFAARVAREAAAAEAHRLDVERRAREQAIRDGRLIVA